MSEATKKTWLEVALNGPWTRMGQPGIPVSVNAIVEQGIACVQAGAAIVHLHAYDEASGRQTGDVEVYARIIEGIRAKVDAIVYPTLPGIAGPGAGVALSAQQRFAHVEALAQRGLIEWAAVDPGSTNMSHYDDLREDKPGFVYMNPEEHVRHGLGLARRFGFHPAYAIYEPGFLRLGSTLHWRESCPAPVYRFMFSRGFTFGFPPEDYGVTAYLNLLDQVAPGAQWMIGGLDVDVIPMIPRALMEGGHVRVGLEDAPLGSDKTNMQWVEQAARVIDNMGGELASARDVRAALLPEDQ
jgi:3-keto-5-aminohexanoate cleavage enzyme